MRPLQLGRLRQFVAIVTYKNLGRVVGLAGQFSPGLPLQIQPDRVAAVMVPRIPDDYAGRAAGGAAGGLACFDRAVESVAKTEFSAIVQAGGFFARYKIK